MTKSLPKPAFNTAQNQTIMDQRLAEWGITRNDVVEIMTLDNTCYIFTNIKRKEESPYPIDFPTPLMLNEEQYNITHLEQTAEALNLVILYIPGKSTKEENCKNPENVIAINPDHFEILALETSDNNYNPITTLVNLNTTGTTEVYGTVENIMKNLGKTKTIHCVPSHEECAELKSSLSDLAHPAYEA